MFNESDILPHAKILWNYHTMGYHGDLELNWDALVGLGSYDESVAQHTASLYLSGKANRVVFSGKYGNWTRNLYKKSEAAHFADIAVKMGVPAEKILLEEASTNIGANIDATESLLYPDYATTCMYITKPQTQRRVWLTLKKKSRLHNYSVSAPRRNINDAIKIFGYDLIVSEMVGDIDRILKYPDNGFMAYEEVSSDVLDAFQALKSAGFTKHLL